MIVSVCLSPAVDKIYCIDNFKTGELHRVANVVKSAGGKGVNVARVLSLQNEKVRLLGFKAGYTGDWIEDQVRLLGIETEFLRVEGETRTNCNIIDRLQDIETEILEPGPILSDLNIESLLDAVRTAAKDASILICSGGLPAGAPQDLYYRITQEAKALGVRVILDTSNEALAAGIRAKPYLIKPNIKELEQYVGNSLGSLKEVVYACKTIIHDGVSVVAVSMGKEGALMVMEEVSLKAWTPPVAVVNTVGSGDSMVAGLAAALSKNNEPREALRLGMACAAANTQFQEIGMISRALVDKYIREIKIIEI